VYHRYDGKGDVSTASAWRKKMTFQVGFFGNDGMLLAGDTRAVQESDGQQWTTAQSKFIADADMNIVIAQSGFSVALRVANRLIRENWCGAPNIAEQVVEDIYRDEYGDNFKRLSPRPHPMQLIVVRPKERRMFHVCVDAGTVVTEPLAGKVVSGFATLALLFLERYVPPNSSLNDLKPLAALTVWLTGEIASFFVNGLEMMEFPHNENPRRLGPKEIKGLLEWSMETDTKIRQLLVSAG